MADKPDRETVEQLWRRHDYNGILSLWRRVEQYGALTPSVVTKVLAIHAVRAALAMRNPKQALTIIGVAKLTFPNDFYMAALTCEAKQAAGDIFGAAEAVDQAITLNPIHEHTLHVAAKLFCKIRDYRRATEMYKRLLDLFFERGPNNNGSLGWVILVQLYAINGPKYIITVAEYLVKLISSGFPRSRELAPFLERITKVSSLGLGDPFDLTLVAEDIRSSLMYEGRHPSLGTLDGYGIDVLDHPQHYLVINEALVSSSEGLIVDGNKCFAVDHAFHSSEFKAEFQTETKTTLISDAAILGFHLPTRRIWIDTARNIVNLDEDVLVIPPGHYTNFGHFVHDVLMLKYGFDRAKLRYPKLRAAVCGNFVSPIFEQLFRYTFGEPIVLQRDAPLFYRFRSVHLLTPGHAMWPRNAAVSIEPARYMASHLRKFARGTVRGTVAGSKVFVARRQTGDNTSTQNMEGIFEDVGFELVDLGKLDPHEYFTLLSSATHLAGIHGAGLMNLIFGRQDLRVAEVKRPRGNWHSIATIARAVGVDFTTFDPYDNGELEESLLETQLDAWNAG